MTTTDITEGTKLYRVQILTDGSVFNNEYIVDFVYNEFTVYVKSTIIDDGLFRLSPNEMNFF
jgi:hypothetical protein